MATTPGKKPLGFYRASRAGRSKWIHEGRVAMWERGGGEGYCKWEG